MMEYINPKSLTWWAGTAALAVGGAQASGIDGKTISVIGDVIGMVGGLGAGASPAGLITLGLGLWGIRRKLSELGSR